MSVSKLHSESFEINIFIDDFMTIYYTEIEVEDMFLKPKIKEHAKLFLISQTFQYKHQE